jgi:AcrR family transcriptional regulator
MVEVPACDPRVARSRAAVLEATVRLLGEVGHGGTTIEAIAERSGVAKTTIYRHWPSRARLLLDAFERLVEPVPVPDTGDVREDLLTVARGLAAMLRRSDWSRVLATLIDAAQSDPELAELAREFNRERRRAARTVLERAMARGELPAGIDADLYVQLMGGFLFYRRLLPQDPAPDATVVQAVDAVLAAAQAGPRRST